MLGNDAEAVAGTCLVLVESGASALLQPACELIAGGQKPLVVAASTPTCDVRRALRDLFGERGPCDLLLLLHGSPDVAQRRDADRRRAYLAQLILRHSAGGTCGSLTFVLARDCG